MYRFSKDVFEMSAGNFREFLKSRFPSIKKKEIDDLVKTHYGSSPKDIETEAEVYDPEPAISEREETGE